MPMKRKNVSTNGRRITSWLRSTRARTGRRANVTSKRRKRAPSRMARSRRGARRRIGSYRKRAKGGSSLAKLTRILAPVNTYSFQIAGRASCAFTSTLTAAGTSVAGLSVCKWFTPNRTVDTSLAYPNYRDVFSVARHLNSRNSFQGFTGASGFDVTSMDFKYVTRNYKQSTKIVNQCNAQSILVYHEIVARQDIPLVSVSDNFNYDLLKWLGKGFFMTAIRQLDNDGVDNVGDTPTTLPSSSNEALSDNAYNIFNSGPFLHFFKVRRMRTVVMNAGDIRMFELNRPAAITHRPASWLTLEDDDNTYGYNNNNPQYCFKKGSVFQLFKLSGTPVNSASVSANVNTSAPAVDFVTNVSYTYQAVVKEGGVNVRASNYGLAAMDDGQFMGEQTDSPLPVINA